MTMHAAADDARKDEAAANETGKWQKCPKNLLKIRIERFTNGKDSDKIKWKIYKILNYFTIKKIKKLMYKIEREKNKW